MKSKSTLYELILSPVQTYSLPKMPTGAMLEKALPGCVCSDLFVKGFSYKPLNLGAGIVAEDDAKYRLLKGIKSARFIADRARLLSPGALLAQLKNGALQILGGYIGYCREVDLAVRPVRLPTGNFGIELHSGSLYRCFAKTENSTFPRTLTLGECVMEVRQVLPAVSEYENQGVLQCNLPLNDTWHVAGTSSRFKLSFDSDRGCKVVCAGSVISQDDYFGNGVLF